MSVDPLPSRRPLLTVPEAAIWTGSFLVVSALLVVTRFASVDPDSALYASLSERLSGLPASHWIAPEWWGYWNGQGLFIEHPAGIFLLPTALSRLGIPAVQASYIVGIAAGLAVLLLLGLLVRQLASSADARASLVLLQLMPVAFLFRIRANHEYPMLLCLLMALIGLDRVRRSSWWWTGLVIAGFVGGLLVKGAFVVLILLGGALWIALNPSRSRASVGRPFAAYIGGLAAMGVAALAYDAAYAHATGHTFWGPYWHRQLQPVTISTPVAGASALASHALFYASRLVWHPAPWSLALIVAGWRRRRHLRSWWSTLPASTARGLAFALGFAVVAIGLLSPSSRFAERYAFSAVYMIATAGAVVAYRTWGGATNLLNRLEQAVPAFPALVWLALMLLRLALGPFLPRIS